MAANQNQSIENGGLLPANLSAPYESLSAAEINTLFTAYHGVKWSNQSDYVVRVYERRSGGLIAPSFSLLAMSASYPIATITGGTVQIGGVQMATIEGRENAEISLETYDFADGQIKKWIEAKSNQVVQRNGLHGLPDKYAFMVQIVHGVRQSKQNYSRLFMCRPSSCTTSLQTDGTGELERLSITFAQLDPFMGS